MLSQRKAESFHLSPWHPDYPRQTKSFGFQENAPALDVTSQCFVESDFCQIPFGLDMPVEKGKKFLLILMNMFDKYSVYIDIYNQDKCLLRLLLLVIHKWQYQ
uniref:Uncharacterized protein n=1 Tax=Sphaerodactylus townsendi TaxID=933632 RepID=A0ACB8F9C1_9SAUR